jgi:hypothetical protein
MTRHMRVAIATVVLVSSLYLSGIFSGIGSVIGNNFVPAYAQASTNSQSGLIGSIQNNPQGKPAWALTGVWTMDFANGTSSTSRERYNNVTDFRASITMVMLTGAQSHGHVLSKFKQSGPATINSTAITVNGTATVTMKNGPVSDVPISISLYRGKAIAIWIDPSKTSNHFGDTPIYGTIGVSSGLQKQLSQMTDGSSTTARSSESGSSSSSEKGSSSSSGKGTSGDRNKVEIR